MELTTLNYKPLQKSWSNEPTHIDLQKDFDAAYSEHTVLLGKLSEWQENFKGGAPIKARTGKSTTRPRIIRKNAEWKYPALEEPFLNTADMFELKPRTYEDAPAAVQNSVLLNYYWTTKVDKVKLVGDVVRRLVDEGTVIVKTGWYSEEEEYTEMEEHPVYATPDESLAIMQRSLEQGLMDEVQVQAMQETGAPVQIGVEEIEVVKTRLVENHPTYEVKSNESVMVDPTCNGNLREAQFIIDVYDVDKNTLMKNKIKKHEDGTTTGIYKNLKYIDFEADNSTIDEINPNKSNFVFSDKARKKIRVVEYWGYWDIHGTGETTAIVATWVGDVMIRLEENPFPHQELPFSIATYMPIKDKVYGEPDGELLRENQASIGKMVRAAEDITATQAIGQRLVNEQLFTNPSQWDAYIKGNDARFNATMDPKNAIYKANVEPVSSSVFQMIDLQQRDSESLTGTKAFSEGISGQALGNSVGGIRSALDATSKRELSILRRLSDLLFKDMARMTIINTQAYAGEEETIRITNEEFVTIRREDLRGEFDLVVDVSTPEKDNETAQDLGMVLQTNAASMDPGLAAIVLSKIMTLKKQPDLAKQILEYKPEPDPVQQQLQQMQLDNANLENQKLQMEIAALAKGVEDVSSKIVERESRAEENGVDLEFKTARTEESYARAELYKSQTDDLDLDHIRKKDGITRREQQEDKEFDALAAAERDQEKASLRKGVVQ